MTTDTTENPNVRNPKLMTALAIVIVLGWILFSAFVLAEADPTLQTGVAGVNSFAFYVVLRWAFGDEAFEDAQDAVGESTDEGAEESGA